MSFIQKVKDYYPKYLSAHQNKWNRRMHLLGQLMTFSYILSVLSLSLLYSLLFLFFLVFSPFVIYVFAWFGHLVFEKNKPATWTVNPLLTKTCDLMMTWDIIRGKIPF